MQDLRRWDDGWRCDANLPVSFEPSGIDLLSQDAIASPEFAALEGVSSLLTPKKQGEWTPIG